MRQRANPDTRGGGLAKVDDAIANGESHRFIIFTPPDAYSRTWMQRKPGKKPQELGVLFVNAENFNALDRGHFRKRRSTLLAPQSGQAASQRNTMRTVAVRSKSSQK